jgi:hypothetical protein
MGIHAGPSSFEPPRPGRSFEEKARDEGRRLTIAAYRRDPIRRHGIRPAIKGELQDGRQYLQPPALVCWSVEGTDGLMIKQRIIECTADLADQYRDPIDERGALLIFLMAATCRYLVRDELFTVGQDGQIDSVRVRVDVRTAGGEQ